MQTIVKNLLTNLVTFPQDKDSLFRTSARLAYKYVVVYCYDVVVGVICSFSNPKYDFNSHGYLVEFLVDDFLGLSSLYLSTERHTEDDIWVIFIFYLFIYFLKLFFNIFPFLKIKKVFLLVFVLSACEKNSALFASLPSYVKKHSLSLAHIISKYPPPSPSPSPSLSPSPSSSSSSPSFSSFSCFGGAHTLEETVKHTTEQGKGERRGEIASITFFFLILFFFFFFSEYCLQN